MFLFLRGVIKCPISLIVAFGVLLVIFIFINLGFINIIIVVSGYRIFRLQQVCVLLNVEVQIVFSFVFIWGLVSRVSVLEAA